MTKSLTPKKRKAPPGKRPNAGYSPQKRRAVMKKVIEGLRAGIPLTIICSGDNMPCDRTIRDWADGDEVLASAIARAREAGFDRIAQDALEIADETSLDTIKDSEGNDRQNSEWIARSRLRVDTRLKLLAKWDPKRYGDATTVKHADADGEKLPIDDVTKFTRLAAIAAQAMSILEGGDEPADDTG